MKFCHFAQIPLLLIGALLLNEVNSLMFHLQPSGQKCLREEIHKDVLVSGDYEITEVPGQTVDLAVSFYSDVLFFTMRSTMVVDGWKSPIAIFCLVWYSSHMVFLHMFTLQVVDSKGGYLWKKEHAEKGRFTFTTDEYEVYEICFTSKVPHGMDLMKNAKIISISMASNRHSAACLRSYSFIK